jgi:DNA-binding transcriptional ArsR family regulator
MSSQPSAALDATFVALADPVRRSVVAQLTRGPASVGSLAVGHAMTLPGFLKHVRILERAGLVSTRKVGRVRECRLLTAPLSEASDWIERHTAFWEHQLSSLEQFFSTHHTKEHASWLRPPHVHSDSDSTEKFPRRRKKSLTPGRKRPR